MKRSTVFAILAAIAGVAVVLYFVTRPRAGSVAATASSPSAAGGASTSDAARVTRATGLAATGIAESVAEALAS